MPPPCALARSARQLSHLRPSRLSKSKPTAAHSPTHLPTRSLSNHSRNPALNFHTLLATPTWSVRTLLSASPSSSPRAQTAVTPRTLHHLLRLSALPPPTSPTAEAHLLATLHTQLHFVRAIQAVDTANIAPLTAIRDETTMSASSSQAITALDVLLKGPLARESKVGFRRRPRRAREVTERSEQEILVEEKTRGRREGAYYVVESGKAKGAQ